MLSSGDNWTRILGRSGLEGRVLQLLSITEKSDNSLLNSNGKKERDSDNKMSLNLQVKRWKTNSHPHITKWWRRILKIEAGLSQMCVGKNCPYNFRRIEMSCQSRYPDIKRNMYNNPILGKVKMIYSGKMRIDFTRSATKMFGMWFMELSFVPSRRLLQIQFKLVSLNLIWQHPF